MNHTIAVVSLTRLRAMWRSVEYLARGGYPAPMGIDLVHVSVAEQALTLLTTDGVAAAWAIELVEAGDCESLSVNSKLLGDELDAMHQAGAGGSVTLSRAGDSLVLELEGGVRADSGVTHATTWRVPITPYTVKAWGWLTHLRPDTASMDVRPPRTAIPLCEWLALHYCAGESPEPTIAIERVVDGDALMVMSRPAAPASLRKHSVCAVTRIGSVMSPRMRSATEAVRLTSEVGISQRPSVVRNESSANLGNLSVPYIAASPTSTGGLHST